MNINVQLAMQDFISAQSLDGKEISRFTPEDFRLGVQWLVAQNEHNLAQALAEAGLSLTHLHPGLRQLPLSNSP